MLPYSELKDENFFELDLISMTFEPVKKEKKLKILFFIKIEVIGMLKG
jgi:hypothetical protein